MPSNEVAIVGRLIQSDRSIFSPETAREILGLRFGEEELARILELSAKAQAGTLTDSECGETENYRQVGYLLGILWSKARLSLQRSDQESRA